MGSGYEIEYTPGDNEDRGGWRGRLRALRVAAVGALQSRSRGTGASVFVAGDNFPNELYISDREDGMKPGQGGHLERRREQVLIPTAPKVASSFG